ncbi:MAG: serine protease [Verrucomicrobiota bacterium]
MKTATPPLILIVVLLGMLTGNGAEAVKGFVLVKPKYATSDSQVNLLEYTELEKYGVVVKLKNIEGEFQSVMSAQTVAILPLPNFRSNIQNDEALNEVLDSARELYNYSKQYPVLEPKVAPVIARAKEYQDKYKEGLVFIGSQWVKPLSEEERLDIQLDTGRVLKDVKLQSVSGRELVVKHEGGVLSVNLSSIKSDELEKLKKAFPDLAKSKEEAGGDENIANLKGSPPPAEWHPRTLNDAVSCVVLIRGNKGSGTGFLCNVDGQTFIYTNAHVLSGNTRLKCTDSNGLEYNDFLYIEAAGQGFDDGDIVRIALRKGRMKALRLADAEVGSAVTALGNSDGLQVVRKLNGEIESQGAHRIEITSEIVPGNSGGPIVNENFEVVGVATFLYKSRDLWNDSADLERASHRSWRDVRRFGLRANRIGSWNRFKFEDFLRESYMIDLMVAEIRLMRLFSVLGYSASGVRYDPSIQVAGELNAAEVVALHREHPLARKLVEVSDSLGASYKKQPSATTVRSVLTQYANAFSSAHTTILGTRAYVQGRNEWSWYNRDRLTKMKLYSEHASAEKEFLLITDTINKILSGAY